MQKFVMGEGAVESQKHNLYNLSWFIQKGGLVQQKKRGPLLNIYVKN